MRIFFLCLACAASLLLAQPIAAAPLSRIVAVVNGDMITSRELEQACAPEFFGQKIDPAKDPAKAGDVRKAVLDRMINEKILLQEAEKEQINITEEELDNAMEQAVKESSLDRATFLKQLAREGITEKMFRQNLRSQLVSQRLMSRNVISRVVVTEDEINDYYRQNMAGFATGRARVAMIVYPVDADAEKWASDIRQGKVSFANAARAVSVGPNASGGGDMGYVELSDMAPALLEQISHMNKGDVSPLLHLAANFAQVALLDVEQGEAAEASQAVPDPAAAQRIEQILRRPRLEERFKQYTEQLRSRALIEIRQ